MLKLLNTFKVSIGIAIAIISAISGAYSWASNNIVFASEFNRFKSHQELRWTLYDEQQLRSEYYNLRNLRNPNDMDKQRLDKVESELKALSAKRLQIETEQRHITGSSSEMVPHK